MHRESVKRRDKRRSERRRHSGRQVKINCIRESVKRHGKCRSD